MLRGHLAQGLALYRTLRSTCAEKLKLSALTTVTFGKTIAGNAALRHCLVGVIKTQVTTGPTTYSETGNYGTLTTYR